MQNADELSRTYRRLLAVGSYTYPGAFAPGHVLSPLERDWLTEGPLEVEDAAARPLERFEGFRCRMWQYWLWLTKGPAYLARGRNMRWWLEVHTRAIRSARVRCGGQVRTVIVCACGSVMWAEYGAPRRPTENIPFIRKLPNNGHSH